MAWQILTVLGYICFIVGFGLVVAMAVDYLFLDED